MSNDRKRVQVGAVMFAVAAVLTVLVPRSPLPARERGLTAPSPRAKVQPALPLSFEPNRGQANGEAEFLARSPGFTLLLTPSGASLKVARPSGEAAELEMRLRRSRPDARLHPVDPRPGRVNYYVGRDPRKWRRGLPTFGGVLYEEVYPGIDLLFHGRQGAVEYDFRVDPGADPGQIALEFTGADLLAIDEQGDLIISIGEGSIRQHAPVVYQEVEGSRRPVSGALVLEEDRVLRFELGEFDRTRTLVIDPVISYATYLGGSLADYPEGIAIDAAGQVHVTGFTNSLDFPVQAPVQGGNAGNLDLFLSKFNADGSALIFSTYFGGSGQDGANTSNFGGDIDLDSAGNAWIAGVTLSEDFPVTPGAYQSDLATVGQADAVVAKFDPSGALLYSTYFGGAVQDMAHGIAVDSNDDVIVIGQTTCSTTSGFPVTGGAYKTGPVYHPFTDGTDGFITKFDQNGSLVFSTYLGGAFTDTCNGIAHDGADNIVVGGQTNSEDGLFPTVNAYQPTYGGAFDGWVAKLDPTGSTLLFSSYLGGSLADGVGRISNPANGNCVDVDSAGNVYFTGFTNSDDFPVLPGAYQETDPSPSTSAFVTKLAPDGSGLYSTYLGGAGVTYGYGIAVDTAGKAHVTGQASTGIPLVDPISDTGKIYLSVLNPDGSDLIFSTLFGGGEYGQDVVLDSSLDCYLLGQANAGFPTTPGAFQTTGSFACVVVKVSGISVTFIRGDCNADGIFDLSDAIQIFGVLFLGTGLLGCEDACDTNDDGVMDIADGVYVLSRLFVGGSPPPPSPHPGCGLDPTMDSLSCDSFLACP